MKFYFSTIYLIKIFFTRIFSILIFITLGLINEKLLLIPALLFVGITIDIGIKNWKGYFVISETSIKTLHLFFSKKIERKDLLGTFSYDNEWTFRSKEKEIRIQKTIIRKDQIKDFENKLAEVRSELK